MVYSESLARRIREALAGNRAILPDWKAAMAELEYTAVSSPAPKSFCRGRDTTDEEQWPDLLFWGKFVGSDISHKIVTPHCGWAHYPPNASKDYDWSNQTFVESDIEDWKPDGSGTKARMNCTRWNCTGLGWFTLWMQSLPGAGNSLSYRGKPLNNWWVFIGDFDRAMRERETLVLTK
jgi:hypothetical protein